MITAIKWVDDYFVSQDRICLTNRELKIPGVRLLATHNIKNAIFPLLPHYHENAFEFSYIAKGSMSYYTAPHEYTVSGGDVFISFPNEIHSTNDTPISLNQQFWIQLDVSDPENFLFLQPETAESFIQDLYRLDRHVISTHSKRIGTAIEEAFRLSLQGSRPLLVVSCLLLFFQLLLEEAMSDRHSATPDIQAALIYIRDHITEELNLDNLASLCGLSTSQFKQKFRRLVGIAPRNYINKEKIKYSKQLLREGRSITDVAMDLSFNSSSYFSTVFKKYTMKSPKDYIRQISEETPL